MAPQFKVPVGPGHIPDIDLDGPVDPGRMDRMNAQAVREANKAGKVALFSAGEN